MINHFESIFNEWIDQIEHCLEETENMKVEDKDSKEPGPRLELEHWR